MSVFDDVVVLEFDDYPDLEVKMRVSIPIREYLAALDTFDDLGDKLPAPEWMAAIAALVDKHRVSWSLDFDDAMELPGNVLVGIVRSWLRAIAQVPAPLARRSSAGAPSEDQTTSPETSPEPSSSAGS